jgi:patatin-like phospholipase/acyl hydrolase
MSNSNYLILACDGGGIRGLIPSLLLQNLKENFPQLLTQHTYLFAGTSTGGIISLALACQIDPSELVGLYSTDGAAIFSPSACLSSASPMAAAKAAAVAAGQSWWEFIAEHLMDLICPWYDNTGLRNMLMSKLGSNANATLNSLVSGGSPQYVLVNTMQLCDSNNAWVPLQLTNLPNLANNDSGQTVVIDAALSTSAAPMYFPPYNHPSYGYCADGGVFANNPGTIALTTLIESGINLDDIWMLSLSTGNTINCYPSSIINTVGAGNFGPLFWVYPLQQPDPPSGQPYTPALPLMSTVFDGTSDVDAYQCAQLLSGRYMRANVPLSQPIALDDYSPAAITAMENSVNTYLGGSDWASIGTWITNNFG